MLINMNFIDGGVTSPNGFTANGCLAGIKKGRTTNDTALIFSDTPCACAAIFTKNLVQAEPVKLSKRNAANGRAQAVIANSGNANACTGQQGMAAAERMARATATALSLDPADVLVCSTGVIGQQLPVECIENCIEALADGLSKDGHEAAREAIMTTDTVYKECAVETIIGGKTVRIGTMAKGSGMIHINMGTMLGFITTDCAISPVMLDKALRESADGTYNCVSVDGDTSTNDTLLVLANGKAGNREIDSDGADYNAFLAALNAVNTVMAKKIAGDGEGAEHLIECHVTGAASVTDARVLAKSVVSSNLVKAAFFGKDANWGRVLCALGYAGVAFNPDTVSVSFENKRGKVALYRLGVPLDFDEGKAKEILSEVETRIEVSLGEGKAEGFAWGCDLTYEYVKINGDYRT
jgi:glutamate N-acetyltransferase/amino-acid N-acetyltransferase